VGRVDLPNGECQAAQAAEFIRALLAHLHGMTSRLAWIERHHVGGSNARASEMRTEAASLRREINEARILIDRLQHRYPKADKHNAQRRVR
jgi:hypothetical protein